MCLLCACGSMFMLKSEEDVGCCLLFFSAYSLETGSLTEPEAHLFREVGYPGSSGDLLVSTLQALATKRVLGIPTRSLRLHSECS